MDELSAPMVQLDMLDAVQDELVCALESLAYDYTRQAKNVVFDLIKSFSAMTTLDASYRASLIQSLGEVMNEMTCDRSSQEARIMLITLRRRVTNTRLHLKGKEPKYKYADILAASIG